SSLNKLRRKTTPILPDSSGAFASEVQFLRAPYEDDMEDKQYNDEYGYTPSNGSHMQLTYGRNRKPQSDI
ncbi:unnamed protein product, partial [Rotaria sordida]